MVMPEQASIDINVVTKPVEIDPFQQAASQFDPTLATRIEFGGDGQNARSLEELLVERNFAVADSAARVESAIQPEPETKDIVESSGISFDQPRQTADQLLNAAQTVVRTASSASISDFSKGQSGGESRSEGGEDTALLPGDLSSVSLDAGRVSGKSDTFISKLSGENNQAQGPKSEFTSKILAHAQMMLKSGGGAMKVAVEAPGIGQVDVAINLINNQLDVRIITASEQARDMISREISGLRDGLGQQGLSLRGVEIAKAGESAARNFAGQGQQQFGQGNNGQRATYDDMREYARSFKNSYTSQAPAARVPTMQRASAIAGSTLAGRLEVRV